MKLQNLTVIFIIIVVPIVLIMSLYISTGLRTIKYQGIYDAGLLTATHDAIYAFELNTTNDAYSDNAETKRNILKASVKMFEKSLTNACDISSYLTDEIEEYIPAIVFGMYDGFYMYAPSELYNQETGQYEYKHGLKNYVYYSEKIENEGIVIRYSLDNYVYVSGDFGSGYEVREGYLIDLSKTNSAGNKYGTANINTSDADAIEYYKNAYNFTYWFLNTAKIGNKTGYDYLKIGPDNDPEDENSAFVQHKRTIIKDKIESVLNSSITAYSEKTFKNNYKMPSFSEEDWQKIYSNISMITFFQGKNIGLTKYNGYCVLNSTNHNEYVNPNLIYFIDSSNTYHDIRCPSKTGTLNGYKIGSFTKKKEETTDASGNVTTNYVYEHDALACYNCINGSLDKPKDPITGNLISVYEYINNYASSSEKNAYYTALGRERQKTIKLLSR